MLILLVLSMPSINIAATVSSLDRILTTHGFPETLVSDNRTQFGSSQFEEYCKQRTGDYIRTPPCHCQSNGQAEQFVDAFKRVLLKAKKEGATEDVIQKFLLSYRSTPHPMMDSKSLAELLVGRAVRTINHAMLSKNNINEPAKSRKVELLIRTDG